MIMCLHTTHPILRSSVRHQRHSDRPGQDRRRAGPARHQWGDDALPGLLTAIRPWADGSTDTLVVTDADHRKAHQEPVRPEVHPPA